MVKYQLNQGYHLTRVFENEPKGRSHQHSFNLGLAKPRLNEC